MQIDYSGSLTPGKIKIYYSIADQIKALEFALIKYKEAVNNQIYGLCYYVELGCVEVFKHNPKGYTYGMLVEFIPSFNRENCMKISGIEYSGTLLWWDLNDSESRIKVLETLIERLKECRQ